MTGETNIDQRALDSLSVAPPEDSEREAHDPRQEAGQDKSIAERLRKNPESRDARLDNALDESMDASDPPAATPVHHQEPAPSSGYDAAEEARLQREKTED